MISAFKIYTPFAKPSRLSCELLFTLLNTLTDWPNALIIVTEIFSAFTKHLTDNLPPEIDSTLDPVLHRVPGLHLAVDTIFSTPEYVVKKVRTIAGVSDHKAIVGEIERR